MKETAPAYPATGLVVAIVAVSLLVPLFSAFGSNAPLIEGVRGTTSDSFDPESASLNRAIDGSVSDSGLPLAPRNATSLIVDGTFDAIPGPWTYTNGTTGAVTAGRDPTARARLGHTSPVLKFDPMDNVFGPTPWTRVVSANPEASSTLYQETTNRTEGTGSMRDDVEIFQNNGWGGAIRDDALPWNWSGYDRLGIWMNKATPVTLWTWVYVEDGAGRSSWGLYALVTGWYRYAFDLNAPLDASQVNFIQIAFAGSAGTSATVYIDDIVLFNSTTFAETASVGQTFTKTTPTGGSPNSLRLDFDLEVTAPLNVVSYLGVAINNTVEWSETPVTAGTRAVSVDVSGNVALQGTGSFTLAFSLRLNRTGWEEASMMAWIDNVTLVIPGTLARIAISPSAALVPVTQTAHFTAEGWDTDGNRVPLTAMNWSSSIGQIIAANETAATLLAPNQPGTGVVSAKQGNITGTANVTVRLSGAAGGGPAWPWDVILWPGLPFIAAALGGIGLIALRRAALRTFRIEDVFLINREGLLIAHATHRRDAHGDEDILAGMLTAIMSFAQDSFHEESEGLKRFEIGNRKVALERSEHVYLAVIGMGLVRDRLSASLKQLLWDIEGRYGEKLRWWSGMAEELTGIDGMVESFAVRGVYRRGDWRRRAPARVTGPAGVVKPAEPRPGIDETTVREEPLRPVS